MWKRNGRMPANECFRILDLQKKEQQEGIEDGIKLPSVEIARTFAVETIDYPRPLGFQYVSCCV